MSYTQQPGPWQTEPTVSEKKTDPASSEEPQEYGDRTEREWLHQNLPARPPHLEKGGRTTPGKLHAAAQETAYVGSTEWPPATTQVCSYTLNLHRVTG